MIRIEFKNEAELLRKINRLNSQITQSARRGLREAAEEVMAKSKEFVPVDTGALRESGHVSRVKTEGNLLSVEMAYGNSSTRYARRVHEWLGSNVHWSVDGTGPKYLERPYLEMLPEIPAKLLETFRSMFVR